MPQYKKVFDIGTYTGNGGMYRVGIPTLRGVGPSGKQVANGLRFRSAASSYLTRVVGTPTNNNIYTLSTWFKKSTNGSNLGLFGAWASASTNLVMQCYFNTSDQLRFVFTDTGGSVKLDYITTQVFKDSSKWYHILVSLDNSLVTTSYKLYIDGVQVTSFGTSTNTATQNGAYAGNKSGWNHYIGNAAATGGSLFAPFDGYMSETYMIDGQVLTPSSFGEYNSDGIWVPKAYSGSYSGNSYYLNYNGNAGTDASGLGGNFTPTAFNVATSNATYSLLTDSPTDYGTDTGVGAEVRGNYCTWDPNTKGSTITLDSGNLGYTVGGVAGLVCPATFTLSSGKWFWEVTLTSGYGGIGVAKQGYTASMSYIGIDTTSWGFYSTLGKVYNNTFTSAYGTYTTNDVIGVALDADAGSITFYKNGVSLGVAFTGMTGPYIPITSVNGAGTGQANFGQRAFAYAAPSGYKALTTTNITRPTDQNLWFYGDTPDLMWIKNRSTTGLHVITDTVRGMGLNAKIDAAAQTSYPAVTEMNKFGMTVINDATSIVNGSTNSHVYWGWKAGSNTSSTSVTNTTGTITSQVSANPSAGFSIVSWTGNGTGGTIGHGLGAVPFFIIVKAMNGSDNWVVYHASLGNTYAAYLNTTAAAFQAVPTASAWNNTSPTSSVFSVGSWTSTGGGSGYTMLAYCWAGIPGYSAFGSYTGNGSADGPFIYTGFRPRFLIIKNASSTTSWTIVDTTRDTYNVTTHSVYADLSNGEDNGNANGYTNLDILSNGFKVRQISGIINNNAQSYIYAAFAEIPFNFSRAR